MVAEASDAFLHVPATSGASVSSVSALSCVLPRGTEEVEEPLAGDVAIAIATHFVR